MKVEIRDFTESDIENLIPVLLDTWDYGGCSTLEKREAATRLYLLHALSCSSWRKVLTIDDAASGILCSRASKDCVDGYYSSIYKSLSSKYREDKDIDELCKYNDVIISADDELVGGFAKPCEEVVLLILSSKTKGKGFGRLLMETYLRQRQDALPTVLTSDPDCNYRFYERLGFRKVDAKEFGYTYFGKEETMTSFLFCLD